MFSNKLWPGPCPPEPVIAFKDCKGNLHKSCEEANEATKNHKKKDQADKVIEIFDKPISKYLSRQYQRFNQVWSDKLSSNEFVMVLTKD